MTFQDLRYRHRTSTTTALIGLDEVTPWDHLDVRREQRAHLVREYKKATMEARTTQPCNRQCSACGANKLIGGTVL